jgi:hypothetical protein
MLTACDADCFVQLSMIALFSADRSDGSVGGA